MGPGSRAAPRATVLPVAGEVAKRIDASGRTWTVLGAVLGQRDGELVEAALASARSLAASAAVAVRG